VPAISYRRRDTLSATGRLADTLATRFSSHQIFRDVDAIEAGADFRAAVAGALESVRVIAIPAWADGDLRLMLRWRRATWTPWRICTGAS
jgi:hypothetical protein